MMMMMMMVMIIARMMLLPENEFKFYKKQVCKLTTLLRSGNDENQ